jgi:hypothetical protein
VAREELMRSPLNSVKAMAVAVLSINVILLKTSIINFLMIEIC